MPSICHVCVCVCVCASYLGTDVFVFQMINFLHSDEYTYSQVYKILNGVYAVLHVDGSEILVTHFWESIFVLTVTCLYIYVHKC